MMRWLTAMILALTFPVLAEEVRSVDALREACEEGDARACDDLGGLYQNGEGVERNVERAVELYEKACEMKLTAGCYNLGVTLAAGEGVEQDDARALELFLGACYSASPIVHGCHNAAVHYGLGHGVEVDKSMAFKLFWEACVMGYEPACHGHAVTEEELHQLKGCEKGDPASCFEVAHYYKDGDRGFARDSEHALELFGKACDGGHLGACHNHALMMVRWGSDLEAARASYRKACEGGVGGSCVNLANMSDDTSEASSLYDTACALNHPVGCFQLAQSYRKRDEKRALELFQRACAMGFEPGCRKLEL